MFIAHAYFLLQKIPLKSVLSISLLQMYCSYTFAAILYTFWILILGWLCVLQISSPGVWLVSLLFSVLWWMSSLIQSDLLIFVFTTCMFHDLEVMKIVSYIILNIF